MTLEITEDWIVQRIELDHDNLDDVKSLSLPGTYHEKITGLGLSLQNFTRLQQLNLAKNKLTSLKGLEHLSLLEQLNLYYNKIEDLKEIFRLRKNQNLRDIDLRLNPVTGNEPDYRLFIAHMLPLLRRLDDRPVRDSERKAALMHFSASNVGDMFSFDDEVEVSAKSAAIKSRQPRVGYVKNITQKPSVVQDDDTITDVIDYVNKGMGKTTNPPQSSEPSSQVHSQEELLRIVRKQAAEETRKLAAAGDHRIKFAKELVQDKNLKFTDQDSAYTQFQSLAHFTPHPGSNCLPPTVNQESSSQVRSTMSPDRSDEMPERARLNFEESGASRKGEISPQAAFIESFLNIVDRYWNGSKSLHYHPKFQNLILRPLENYEKEITTAKQAQIKVLHDKLLSQQRAVTEQKKKIDGSLKQSTVDPKLSEKLLHAQKELESTKSRMQHTISDNKILRDKVAKLEGELRERKEAEEAVDEDRVLDLEQQKKELLHQVATLKRSTEQYEKISQLATMLQDSHRSLVSTNEHLLSELDEARSRHQSEIEQLKWSYDQLRSTSKLTNGHAMNGEV